MHENGCCDDDTTTVLPSPKEDLRKRRGGSVPVFMELKNPIPVEITDGSELSTVIEKHKLVPFAGLTTGTGHSLLAWYLMLAKLSPTNGAVIDKVSKYAFGGRAMFARSEDPEYDMGEVTSPLTVSEKTAYQESLKQFIEFEGGIRKFHRQISSGIKAHGNAWVEMSVATVKGQTRVHLRYVRQTNVMYRYTTPDEMSVAFVSPMWTDDYLRKNKPQIVPLYPNFVDTGGAKKTLFHLKTGDNRWYGRPDSQGADLYKYREVQDAMYIVKQAANNFTGQIIIEVEDDGQDPEIDEKAAWESGFDSFADRIIENYTQRGKDPMSAFVTSRPFGSKPMFVFQVQPNTNQAWYKETGAMSEAFIISAHGVTPRFMGKDVSNGFSNDAFVSDYVMNMEPVINDHRNTVLVFTNQIITAAWEAVGRQEMIQYSVTFQSPIQGQIDRYYDGLQQVTPPLLAAQMV